MKLFWTTVLALTSLNAFGQSALDLPVDNLTLAGFSSNVPVSVLLSPDNLLNAKNDDGKLIRTKIDRKTVQGRTATYVLSTTADGKPLLKTILRFDLKEAEDSATLVYVKITVVPNNQVSEVEYDGTEESLGQVLGMFAGLAGKYLLDVKKINNPAGN